MLELTRSITWSRFDIWYLRFAKYQKIVEINRFTVKLVLIFGKYIGFVTTWYLVARDSKYLPKISVLTNTLVTMDFWGRFLLDGGSTIALFWSKLFFWTLCVRSTAWFLEDNAVLRIEYYGTDKLDFSFFLLIVIINRNTEYDIISYERKQISYIKNTFFE